VKSSRKLSFLPPWGMAKEGEEVVCSPSDAEPTETKHQQIADRARKLFVENGRHPTTIRRIASACGISSGHLYRYISSKDDASYLVHKHMLLKLHEDMDPGGHSRD